MTAARDGNRKIMTPLVDAAEALQAPEEETWRALTRGYRVTGLLVSVTRLGLLRELADHERATTSELADQLVADEGLLERMCRALESIGMLADADGGWRDTAVLERDGEHTRG